MYLFFYLYAVFVSYIVLSISNKKKLAKSSDNKGISIIKILIIAIIFGIYSGILSSEKLVDRQNYDYMFLYRFPLYENTWEQIINSTIEPGFIILNLLIRNFSDNLFWLYFFISFITVFIDMYVLNKLTKGNKTILLIYLLSIQIFFGTYLCRQAIAASIINLSFLAFIKNKKLITLLCVLIATWFHATAIIMIPFFVILLLSKLRLNIVKPFLLFSILVFIFFEIFQDIFYRIEIVNNYLGEYKDKDLSGNSLVPLKGLPYHLITIYGIIQRKKIGEMLKNADIYIAASVFVSLCWLFSYNMYWLYRLSIYAIVPSLILIPYLINVLKTKKEKSLYFYSIVFSMILMTFREIAITLYPLFRI